MNIRLILGITLRSGTDVTASVAVLFVWDLGDF